jgi:hypothetical protein
MMTTNNAVNNNPQGKSNVYLSACLPQLTVVDNVTGNGTYFICKFTTINFNSSHAYNSTTGIWSCPDDGVYQAQLNIQSQFHDQRIYSLQGIFSLSFGGGSPLAVAGSYEQTQTTTFTDQPFTLTTFSPPLKMLAGFDNLQVNLFADGGFPQQQNVTIMQDYFYNAANANALSIEIVRLGK